MARVLKRGRNRAAAPPGGTAALRTDLSTALLRARLERGLSQTALAKKLGLGQRQISDLERSAMDPRLSTVQNVARALDLELVLIPRPLIRAVDNLRQVDAGASSTRPMYELADDEDDEEGAGDRDALRVPIGDEARSRRVPARKTRQVAGRQ